MPVSVSVWRKGLIALCVIACTLLLGALSQRQFTYLLFHLLIELSSIVVGVAIFSIGWSTRRVAGSRLLMLARTGSGCKYAAWSDDGGDSWSAPQPTTLTAACSSLTLKTQPDGRLLVLYNPAEPLGAGAFFPRTPLSYAVSADGGHTWGEPVLIDDAGALLKDRQNIYPSVCFTPEGMVVVYSVHAGELCRVIFAPLAGLRRQMRSAGIPRLTVEMRQDLPNAARESRHRHGSRGSIRAGTPTCANASMAARRAAGSAFIRRCRQRAQ